MQNFYHSLKYAGPKPIYSSTGIDFQINKEDKFIYLEALCELIETLDQEYVSSNEEPEGEEVHKNVQIGANHYTPQAMFHLLHGYVHNLNTLIDQRLEETTKIIEDDLERSRHNSYLNSQDRAALIKNIEIMRSYQLQRSVNKCVYYAGVEALAGIVKARHIRQLTVTIEPHLLHVLHSLQGALEKLHPPVFTKIDIFEHEKHLLVELEVMDL